MSEELQRISYDPAKTDLRSIKFEQSESGHVHSPWFTYDHSLEMKDGKMVYGFGYGKFPHIIAAAKSAFAAIFGMNTEDVVVTQKPDFSSSSFESQWRLSTPFPVRKLEIKKPMKPAVDGDDVIDVEAVKYPPEIPE